MSLVVGLVAALTAAVAAGCTPYVAGRFLASARLTCAGCDRPFGTVCPGRGCGPPRRRWPPVVTSAVVAGGLGLAVGASPPALVLIPAAGVAVLLAVIDARCLRLPDRLVAALAVLVTVPPTVGALWHGDVTAPGRALSASAAVGLGYLVVALLPSAGLGLGDVKLAAVLGFPLGWAGWPAVLLGLVVAHLIGGVVASWLLLRRGVDRRTALPFGPALLAGAAAAIATAGPAPDG